MHILPYAPALRYLYMLVFEQAMQIKILASYIQNFISKRCLLVLSFRNPSFASNYLYFTL